MSRPQTVSTDEILSVARAHFIERGHSATLSAISQDLGVSHSALIQRFGSKRRLLIESMLPPEELPWGEAFQSGPPPDPRLALLQLEEVCSMLMRVMRDLMPRIRVLLAAGVDPSEIFHDRLPLPLVGCQRLSEWVERGVERGLFRCAEPAAVASLIVSAMFFRSRLTELCTLSSSSQGADPTLEQGPLLDSLIGSHAGVIALIAQSLSLNSLAHPHGEQTARKENL